MKKTLALLMFSVLMGSTAEAQIARVFVGVDGNDANDCLQPPTACRTLNGAVAKVDAGGEVIVTQTGSYAGATITKSVKINVPSGVVAFSALSVTVNAGAADVVVIRGLTLKAFVVGTGTGLNVQSAGAVFVENCVIDGWATGVGVNFASQVFVKDTIFRNNVTAGLDFNQANSVGVVDGAHFESQGGAAAAGLSVRAGKVSVSRSFAALNGFGFHATGAGSELVIDQTEASENSTAGYEASSGATLRLLDSFAAGNAIGLRNNASGATVETFGNNVFRGNTTETSGTVSTVTKQ